MQLGVGLFENRNPKLIALTRGKHRLAFDVARNQLVHSYFFPPAVFAKPDSVDAKLVVRGHKKQASN